MKNLLSIILMVLMVSCAHIATLPTPFSNECPRDYPVKGNLSESGKKIFHTPSSPWYEETMPETCFKSIEDAFEAGFVPPERW